MQAFAECALHGSTSHSGWRRFFYAIRRSLRRRRRTNPGLDLAAAVIDSPAGACRRHEHTDGGTEQRNTRPVDYRTIWISDVHLGTRGCKADLLLDFLRHNESDQLYLVGDIIDGWRIRRSWYWNPSHSEVIRQLLRKAKEGTRICYIPGNHDEALRDYPDLEVSGIRLMRQAMHETADGRRLLVLHGDDFDGVVRYARWLALLGDWAYELTIRLNHVFNLLRRRLGYPYWSLSAYLKSKVKNAVQFIADYAEAVAAEARRSGVDGIVCGHIHYAEIRDLGGVLYCNDGDWVESCTALVEHFDGMLEIVRWTELRGLDLFDFMCPAARYAEAAS
jgi:UDP-2,3-diacylglucosamine pyrophosphatase LpxH